MKIFAQTRISQQGKLQIYIKVMEIDHLPLHHANIQPFENAKLALASLSGTNIHEYYCKLSAAAKPAENYFDSTF